MLPSDDAEKSHQGGALDMNLKSERTKGPKKLCQYLETRELRTQGPKRQRNYAAISMKAGKLRTQGPKDQKNYASIWKVELAEDPRTEGPEKLC